MSILSRPVATLVLLLPALAAQLRAADAPPEANVPLVDERVRELMQDRNYAEAIQALDQAAQAEGAAKDYIAYLKGRALFLQKQYDAAVAAFAGLETDFPTSRWARRARFARALALARKGDFRGAELIYRKEAKYLLSVDRKQELASVYLEFADALFDPPEEEKKPDFERALEFYQKALEVGPQPEKRIEVELLVAQCHHELGKLKEATERYARFVEEHPKTPLNLEARFRLGECRLAQGNRVEARRTWQDLLAEYPDSPSKRIPEAAFQLSRTWQIPKPADDRELSLGVAALEAFVERFPTHKLAGRAYLEIAQSYLHGNRLEEAAKTLVRLLADERYQDREQIPDARHLLGRSYQRQQKYSEAIAVWRDYLSKHPTHEAWSTVQQEIINTEFLMAQEKYEAEQYDDARKLWGEFVAKYPLDGRKRPPTSSSPPRASPSTSARSGRSTWRASRSR